MTKEQAIENANRSESYGHIAWINNYEYYQYKGNVYRGHKTHTMDIYGYRAGRYFCPVSQWEFQKKLLESK